METNTLLVNLYSGPGAGKTSICAGVFSKLKSLDIDCEMALEYCKELIWDESFKKLGNQIYIFGKQHDRLHRLQGKVEVVITDSPILLSIIYDRLTVNPTHHIFRDLVLSEYRKFYNLDFFVQRRDYFQQNGRMQNFDQAKVIDDSIHELLTENNVSYIVADATNPVDDICTHIINYLNYQQQNSLT